MYVVLVIGGVSFNFRYKSIVNQQLIRSIVSSLLKGNNTPTDEAVLLQVEIEWRILEIQ